MIKLRYLFAISFVIFFGSAAVIFKQSVREERPLLGRSTPVGEFNAVFVHNYDGDTIMVDIADLPAVFGHHIPVRVKHVDCPEINSLDPCARAVALDGRDKVHALLSNAKSIKLTDVSRDKYFRLLSNVLIDGSTLLNEFLLENKLAVPYEGDIKPVVDWCPPKP